MKVILALLALFVLLPAPAEASWAIAMVQGGDPIVHVHDGYHANFNDAPGAVSSCNQQYHTNQCRIVAQGVSGCVAFANNGARGKAIRWAIGQGHRKDLADAAALQDCRTQFSGACRVVHDFCQE